MHFPNQSAPEKASARPQGTPARLAGRLLVFGRRIHRDSRGLETLQAVMLLAVAAVSLQMIKHRWPWIRDFFNLAIEILIEN